MSELRGTVAGVDIFTWLHPFAKEVASDVLAGHFTYVARRVLGRLEKMRTKGVIPFVVFDGQKLVGKGLANTARSVTRAKAVARVAAAKADGRDPDDKDLQKAVTVTEPLVRYILASLQAAGEHFMVAPYEADAMLT